MPSLSTAIPQGGFQFVLQHPRLEAKPGETHSMMFAAYAETLNTIGYQLPGEPMRHHLFAKQRSTRDRACAEGWRDVTSEFHANEHNKAPKLSTPSQVAVYEVLTEEPQNKAQLVEASGIADSEWRTTIRMLEERGIAKCTLSQRQRKGASNRAYRYIRGERWPEAVATAER